MTQQKLRSSSLHTKGVLRAVTLIFTAAILSMTSLVPTASAATIDCSDVFTPLSQFVQDGVTANKSFYVRAMNETGVPWELLAAIHYRETSFSHTNPSNGQGIFQFVNGDGGPYTPGPVSDDNFYVQLKYMATRIQTDYALRNASPSAAVTPRALTASEQDINLIKNTLFSYNGRSSLYAQQAAQYGYDPGTQPYEGSPYVMNRFDCPRARMGIITRDYGTIDSVDTRYGAFTIFARLRGDSYWLAMTMPYSWLIYSQGVFYDPERTKPANISMLNANTTYYVRIKARNIGSTTWSNTGDNPIRLGTFNTADRQSKVCDSSWVVQCNRAAVLQESSVTPGNIGTFDFSIKQPPEVGTFKEYFNLVAEGRSWFNDIGMYIQLTSQRPTPLWSLESQAIYSDSARTIEVNPQALKPNTVYYVSVKAKNVGNTVWTNSGPNPVRLGTAGPIDRISKFYSQSWPSPNRPAAIAETSVSPGDNATFNFELTSPSSYGSYKEYFRPVVEGATWMNDIGFYWDFNVRTPTPLWSYVSATAFPDSSMTTSLDTTNIRNTQRFFISVKAKNVGNTVWTNSGPNPVRLGTTGPNDRVSLFADATWPTNNRAATLLENSVPPGQTGTFNFWMNAPYRENGTAMKEYFRPVVEGVTWMNDIGMYIPLTFQSDQWVWQYLEQGIYTDSAYSAPANSSALQKNTTYYLELKVKNISGTKWEKGLTKLGASNPNDRTSVFCDSSWLSCNRPATISSDQVAPGESTAFRFSIKTLSTSGTYKEYFRPVQEGYAWLTDIGLYWQLIIQ